jgi:hypothetical protein
VARAFKEDDGPPKRLVAITIVVIGLVIAINVDQRYNG